MDEIGQIAVAIVVSLLYYIFVTNRKKSQKEDEPQSLVSPDPQPEPQLQINEEEDENTPQITFEELLEEFLPESEKKNVIEEDDHFAPYALSVSQEEDRALAIREERPLKPKFKKEQVNLEELAIKKVDKQPKNTSLNESQSISDMMQSPENIRNAFILNEIMKRPYDNDDAF